MTITQTHLEIDAIITVKNHLHEVFAEVRPQQVDDVVEHIHHRFDDCRIRLYVPLLVEHAAHDVLEKSRTPVEGNVRESGTTVAASRV